MKYLKSATFTTLILIISITLKAQFTHQDTLRGSVGEGRKWWDVKQYNLDITVDIATQSIEGTNRIVFEVTETPTRLMQIDLQEPMEIERVQYDNKKNITLPYSREGNVYWIDFGDRGLARGKQSITIFFKGKPRVAVNAPWDGGWVWTRDEKGRPFVTVACQGLGASVWYPCKDYQGDEPDNGASLSITVPKELVAVGNGRLKEKKATKDGQVKWTWQVVNPINSYNIVPYIGYYTNWKESYAGLKGELECSYWVLDYNLERSKKQFGRDVKPMLKCFEDWFGPYPFYEDSYKLVETPHLGMEHQSAVAYGNKYRNGYLGMDLSRTGWGTRFDYIVIHESGHEWFANNITTRDIADMWVHEGFTTYSEVIFVECQFGKKAADEYCRGHRQGISNESPVIGTYGVNKEGSGDMYPKGANLIHTIRQVINDDDKFKQILRGMNKTFYHGITDSREVEEYFIRESGKDLAPIFNQYLRTTKIPELQYRINDKTLSFRWSNCIEGFNMPVKVSLGESSHWIHPTTQWQSYTREGFNGKTFVPDPNFYITSSRQ